MGNDASLKDYLKLHFIVLIWGFTAILGKEIQVSSMEVVLYRTGIATIVLWAFLLFKKSDLRLAPRTLFKILGTGLLIAAHWVLFFESARVSNVSVCLAGMATTSFWTSLAEPVFSSRKIKPFEVILGLIVVGGLYLVFQFEFNNALGLTLAIISAFLAAIFSVLNAKFTHQYSPNIITFYEMLGACIGIFIFIPLYKIYFLEGFTTYAVPNLNDWGFLVLLSVVCTVYAFSVSVELMKRISAFSVNLTVNLEPIYGIALALLIYGDREKMSSGFYLGTLVILLAVLSYPFINKRLKSKAMETDILR